MPSVSPSTLKSYERIVGSAIESVADQSCEEALVEEIALTSDENSKEIQNAKEPSSNEPNLPSPTSSLKNKQEPGTSPKENTTSTSSTKTSKPNSKCSKHRLIGGLDNGWQRRGTGRSYNSSSGHTSMRARQSGKMIGRAGRTKKCAKCARERNPTDHDCRLNYNKSSKSMEADMAKELIIDNSLLNKYNAMISVLIMDDDSSTICALRREAEEFIEKWSDMNHAKKNLTKKLIPLKMSQKVQDYFSNCFSIAIQQNRSNADGVRAALLSIVPHAFGEHNQCGKWCKYSELGEKYVHVNLPHGKPLADINLRVKLSEIFSKFSNDAHKLAPCGSTQGNESFNNVVASKHPKHRHYAGSESFVVRVAAAVCQWNLGTVYVVHVNLKLGLPPGHFAMQYRQTKDQKRKRKAVEASTIQKKRKRVELKRIRSSKDAGAERKEGITHESDCSAETLPELLDNEMKTNSCLLHKLDILPSRGISKRITDVTNLHIVGGEMFFGDTLLKTVSLRVAMEDFLSFLDTQGDQVILMAHNGYKFDFPLMLRNLSRLNLLDEFKTIVTGFSDTLNIFRNILPERRKAKKSFSQTTLAVEYLGQESAEGAHNALADVDILQKLISAIKIDHLTIYNHTQNITDFIRNEALKNVHTSNKISLEFLKNCVSTNMLSRIAKAGINRSLIIDVYKTKGPKGIEMLLSEDVRGRPRVTKHKKSIAILTKAISTSYN
ncbi:uncharacterized protein LOC131663346 [Phymastichus coffea]|uniref:uncharacterized protein LOC131663346 n=1 Tax=Phymastichus coffea TaxID=108790 RepID=UPI00273B2FB8|nr:uncharacterized protein LOC131663346 [Phymastichus coffea]